VNKPDRRTSHNALEAPHPVAYPALRLCGYIFELWYALLLSVASRGK